MSTNTPRAIMSGQAFMVGFYPNGTVHEIKESEIQDAVPPFPINADIEHNFRPNKANFPIHILDTETNYLT